MSKSYPGWRENIPSSQIILFCSYGEKVSRLPGKVSDMRSDERNNESFFVKRESSGYVVFIWDKNYLGHRDLACQQARYQYPGKLFFPYERSVTFRTIF